MKMYEIVKMSGIAKDSNGFKTIVNINRQFKDSRDATNTWKDVNRLVNKVKQS